MLRFLYWIWQRVFSGPRTIKLNKLLYSLSIRGLGILNYESSYLSGEAAWLHRCLSGLSDPIVFDVGANVGNYTAEVLKANHAASVYAFEPHPANIAQLNDSLGPVIARGAEFV